MSLDLGGQFVRMIKRTLTGSTSPVPAEQSVGQAGRLYTEGTILYIVDQREASDY